MSVKRASAFSFLSEALGKILSLMSVIILSRLLTPSELGLYAISASATLMAAELRLLGTGKYLVRESNLTQEMLRSTLGLNILMSFGLGVTLALTAPHLAEFYGYPDLRYLFYLQSIPFFIIPFLVTPNSLFTRKFEFGKIMSVRLTGQIVNFAVTIGLAYGGFSYYSIAIGLAAGTLGQFFLMLYVGRSEIIFIPKFRNLGVIARAGILITIANVLHRYILLIPDMIIGKLGSTRETALFSKGIGALDFFSTMIFFAARPVALPYLSQIKNESGDVKTAYVNATKLVLSLVLPFFAVMSVASYPVVLLLFGSQWTEVPPLVKYLAIWMALRSMHLLAIELFIALGREKLFIAKEAFMVISTVTTLILGFSGGLEHLAKWFVLLGVVDFILASTIVWIAIDLKILEFIKSIWQVLFVAFICFLATFSLSHVIDFKDPNYFYSIAVTLLVNGAIWAALGKIFKLQVVDYFLNIIMRKH